jgi:hypothetical protein
MSLFSKGYILHIRVLKVVERRIVFQIGLFSCGDETPISLERKPSFLGTGAASTLLPCED